MADPILEVRGLKKHFPARAGLFGRTRGWVKAVDGVDFSIHAGETLGLIGESGCGKTTTSKLILLQEPPTAGSIAFQGRDVTGLAGSELMAYRRAVQVVFQDPFSSLSPRMRVEDIIAEPLEIHTDLERAAIRTRVAEVLELVGLPLDVAPLFPHEFSGGQRQRVAIARALATETRLIVLDEPVSALDLSIQAQVLNLLMDLQKEMGLAYLFISHGLSVVRHIADEVMVMYLGKPVETGTAEEVFNRPRHPYTAALLSATPVADPERAKNRIRLQGELPSPLNPPTGCPFNPRCWRATDVCRQVMPPLEGGETHKFACHHPLD